MSYPNPYRIVTIDQENVAEIESRFVTDIEYDTGELAFPDYAEAYLSEGLTGLAYYTLTLPADQGGYGLDPDMATLIAPQIAGAYTAHYAGDEAPTPEILAMIDTYMQSDDPTVQFLGQMFLALWTDLPPGDTDAIIESLQK